MLHARGYVVRKDSDDRKPMWLMHLDLKGVREFVEGTGHKEIYTCIWSIRRTDAKVFEDISEAKRIAQAAGNAYVEQFLTGAIEK